MSPIDLHTHTTASDGLLSPDALIALAKENSVKMLAITDHDTVAGYLSIKNATRTIQLISGVEISTTWSGIGIHIVGLDFDPHHPAIDTLLEKQASARRVRCQSILTVLEKLGMPVSRAELIEQTGHTHIGRPHIARLLFKKGYVSSISQAFKKYLGSGKAGDIKNQWASLSAVVGAITTSGGVAVIAHPDKYKMTRTKLLRFIDEFVEMGGQGIEVISGRQHRDITDKYAKIANDRGLLASLGTDFHQRSPYYPEVGQLPTLPDDVNPVWSIFNRV